MNSKAENPSGVPGIIEIISSFLVEKARRLDAFSVPFFLFITTALSLIIHYFYQLLRNKYFNSNSSEFGANLPYKMMNPFQSKKTFPKSKSIKIVTLSENDQNFDKSKYPPTLSPQFLEEMRYPALDFYHKMEILISKAEKDPNRAAEYLNQAKDSLRQGEILNISARNIIFRVGNPQWPEDMTRLSFAGLFQVEIPDILADIFEIIANNSKLPDTFHTALLSPDEFHKSYDNSQPMRSISKQIMAVIGLLGDAVIPKIMNPNVLLLQINRKELQNVLRQLQARSVQSATSPKGCMDVDCVEKENTKFGKDIGNTNVSTSNSVVDNEPVTAGQIAKKVKGGKSI